MTMRKEFEVEEEDEEYEQYAGKNDDKEEKVDGDANECKSFSSRICCDGVGGW